VAYLYYDHKRQQEQKPRDLLASLLKQLVQVQPSVPERLKSLYEYHRDDRTCPTIDEISETLHSVVKGYSKTFILIDALDECQAFSREDGEIFLSALFKLQATTGANLFATSRPIPEITIQFEGNSTQLEIHACNEDVSRYLDGHMRRLPHFVRNQPKLQEESRLKSAR
jgi:hypothetical protein